MRSSARPSPTKLERQRQQRPGDEQRRDGDAGHASSRRGAAAAGGARAGYFHPTRCISATASGSRRPASLDVDRVAS